MNDDQRLRERLLARSDQARTGARNCAVELFTNRGEAWGKLLMTDARAALSELDEQDAMRVAMILKTTMADWHFERVMEATPPRDAATEQRVAEIRQRAEAATPGPWWVEDAKPIANYGDPGIKVPVIKYRWDDVPTWLAESSLHKDREANFRFIAYAREDVPWLIETVMALIDQRGRGE